MTPFPDLEAGRKNSFETSVNYLPRATA